MNWLAHIFLSDNDIAYQHGNLLADLLKGRSWQYASDAFNAGLKIHQTIDRFTDTHPMVSQSRSRVGKQGYLRGVVIDIVYDYLLANNWQAFTHLSLYDFIDRFHTESASSYGSYPEHARAFITRLIASGHLLEYTNFEGVEKALHRIDDRLSHRVLRRENARDYLPKVKQNIGGIEEDFILFMPQLINHFMMQSGLSFNNHWLNVNTIQSHPFSPTGRICLNRPRER